MSFVSRFTTIDLSHDNRDKVQGASALSPLLFPHEKLQAATLVTQSKGVSSEGPM
ncbi:hypothetical protein P692DRAFT_20831998 [Suillus brevipes Sb2]|nr:hypothetical protein P692DRAFT_20831998 [Suillus brevipes Sb2]